jgi:hypothetical protein
MLRVEKEAGERELAPRLFTGKGAPEKKESNRRAETRRYKYRSAW